MKRNAKSGKRTRYDSRQDKRIKKIERQLSREEVKFEEAGGATTSAADAVVHLTPIAQGTTINQRIGNKINIKSISVKFYLKPNSTVPAGLVTATRVALVADNGSDGSVPTYGNVFGSGDQFAYKNIATNPGRFQIIKDMLLTYVTDTGTNTVVQADGCNAREIKKFWKVGKQCHYKGTASNDVQSGNLYLVFDSNENANPPDLVWRSRVYFTDA